MLDTDKKERNRKRVMYFAGMVAAVCLFGGIPGIRKAVAQYANTLLNNVAFLGHAVTSAPLPPTITNATLATGSTDLAGTVTSTGTATPVLTFGTAYTNAPLCIAASQAESEGIPLAVTPTTLTFNGLVNDAKAAYLCIGINGG